MDEDAFEPPVVGPAPSRWVFRNRQAAAAAAPRGRVSRAAHPFFAAPRGQTPAPTRGQTPAATLFPKRKRELVVAVEGESAGLKYQKVAHGKIKDASVVIVPKEDDLVRADNDDLTNNMLDAWLSIVGAGLAVKSVDALPGAPPVRHAAAALRAPATLQFTPRFDDYHPTLTERWRELARQKDSVWKEARP